jgi:hypothetical protein
MAWWAPTRTAHKLRQSQYMKRLLKKSKETAGLPFEH